MTVLADRAGLIVVHGIGDPAAGEALRDLTDAMEASAIAAFDATVQERRLPDLSAPREKLKFFPVHLRTGVLKGDLPQEIVAAEVFWGSASQLAPGKWGVLQGTVSLLLNVPTLVLGARGEKGVIPTLTWWASMVLASAAFALNALLMLTLGTYIALCYVIAAPPGKWEVAAPVVAGAITLWLSRLSWLWFKESCLAFRLAPLCLIPWFFTERTLQSFATIGVALLGFIVLVVVLLVLAVGLTFVAQLLTGMKTPAAVTATLALSLQFGLWTLIVPLAWQGLFAMVPREGEQKWMLEAFGRAASSNGLQWILAAIVIAAFGVVTVRRWWQARSGTPADRLILHPIVATALFVCVMAGAAVVLLSTVRPEWVASLQALAQRIGNVKLAGAALVIVPLASGQLRLALDLAYDVMFYLYYATEPGRRLLSRTPDTTRSVNPMRARLHAVVDHLVQDHKVSHLIILAHSQGTVIALDELAHSWTSKREYLPPISLVTFGSPITQLYQHYFPSFYPSWDDNQWTAFFHRLQAWTNFYRLDDYVGTTIDPPPAFTGAFHQQAVGVGGHTNYWRDPRFLAALKQHVFSPAAR